MPVAPAGLPVIAASVGRADRPAPDMTGAAWIVVAALCAGTVALKAVGPVTFGGRRLSPQRRTG